MDHVERQQIVPQSMWGYLTERTLGLLLTATLFFTSASLLATSIGDPKLIGPVAVTGIAVLLVGTVVVSAWRICSSSRRGIQLSINFILHRSNFSVEK